MPANKSRNENKIKSPAIKTVLCGLVSSALYFLFVVLFTFLSLKSNFSTSVYMPVGLVIGAITGLINGFICAKINKEKGALYGLISGFVQAVICSVVLFLANGGVAGKGMLISSILIIGLSAAGGIIGVNMKIKKKY